MSEWDFAFGLTGQALEDALSSGATYEEWAVINRQLEQEFMDTDGDALNRFIKLGSWEFDGDYSAPSIARHVTYCNKCREVQK